MLERNLLVFAFVWVCCCGTHGRTDTKVPCDDKRVENVVNLALSKHNELLTEGSLLALYDIKEAKKAQNESGEILFVRFTSRETDCPVGGDKVWHQCDYLQHVDKELQNCQAEVFFTEAGQQLLLHDCSGDAAVGKRVTRHIFSTMMNKLKFGLNFNTGNTHVIRLFDGEADHLVPSASTILVESDLFIMAGRLIGHAFIHGGPGLSGLSPAFICFLTGGSQEEITSLLCLEDCPDLDHRETIALLCLDRELSEEEHTKVLDLCLAWDLPGPSKDNRVWLFQTLLKHAQGDLASHSSQA